MKLKKWLTINSGGAARMTSNRPSLKANEISICLMIDLPRMLFKKPHLEASITIPDDAALRPAITAEVIENVKGAVESATGLQFHITVAEPEESSDEEAACL